MCGAVGGSRAGREAARKSLGPAAAGPRPNTAGAMAAGRAAWAPASDITAAVSWQPQPRHPRLPQQSWHLLQWSASLATSASPALTGSPVWPIGMATEAGACAAGVAQWRSQPGLRLRVLVYPAVASTWILSGGEVWPSSSAAQSSSASAMAPSVSRVATALTVAMSVTAITADTTTTATTVGAAAPAAAATAAAAAAAATAAAAAATAGAAEKAAKSARPWVRRGGPFGSGHGLAGDGGGSLGHSGRDILPGRTGLASRSGRNGGVSRTQRAAWCMSRAASCTLSATRCMRSMRLSLREGVQVHARRTRAPRPSTAVVWRLDLAVRLTSAVM